jgi:hypothetical protein
VETRKQRINDDNSSLAFLQRLYQSTDIEGSVGNAHYCIPEVCSSNLGRDVMTCFCKFMVIECHRC